MNPLERARPASVDELRDAVDRARRAGLRVKAVGSGHSFTGIAVAPGVLLELGALSGLVDVDASTGRATLFAGTSLHEVPALLAPHGLAMTNLGDIDRQTIAGAISTGTHGTGARFGGLASQIVGATMVTADAELVEIAEELLPAIRVSLGALGILATVTVQCVPAFALHALERPLPLEEVLGDLDSFVESSDHVEFWGFPHTDIASTKINTRLPADAPLAPRSRGTRALDAVLAGAVFPALLTAERVAPALTGPVNRMVAPLFCDAEFTEASHRVFVSARGTRFVEMEYALPRDRVVSAMRQLRALIEERGWRIDYPVEVRVAAADDAWLSTAHGRDTGYIAIHRHVRRDHEPYFRAAEEVFIAHGGRPHWGKLHFRDAEYFARLYPRFADFIALREQLDPGRVFANPYLERVLGA